MNQLIQRMLTKPVLTKIDPVTLIQKRNLSVAYDAEEKNVDVEDLEKSVDFIENSQGLVKQPAHATIIIDETNKGYDREALLQKLNEHKKQINQPGRNIEILIKNPAPIVKNPAPIVKNPAPIVKNPAPKQIMVIEEDSDEEKEEEKEEAKEEEKPPIGPIGPIAPKNKKSTS